MRIPIYIAIPVYNGQRTIKQTLTNLLSQTFSDFRILIYDDGSTDRTGQIISQVMRNDGRITLISGDVNVGRGAARNRLLAAAKDGIIAWQDADDTWNPDKLAEQIAFYETWSDQGIDPERAVMISTFRRTSTRGGKETTVRNAPPDVYDLGFIMSEAYGSCPFQLQATFGLASVYLDAGGFDEELNWSEDTDIALKILRSGARIISHQAPKALATYKHSLAGAKGDVVERSQNIIRDRHREFAKENGLDIDYIFDTRRMRYLFNVYLNNKNFARALAITLEPLCRDEPERANMVARNVISVIRALLPEPMTPSGNLDVAGGGMAMAAEAFLAHDSLED